MAAGGGLRLALALLAAALVAGSRTPDAAQSSAALQPSGTTHASALGAVKWRNLEERVADMREALACSAQPSGVPCPGYDQIVGSKIVCDALLCCFVNHGCFAPPRRTGAADSLGPLPTAASLNPGELPEEETSAQPPRPQEPSAIFAGFPGGARQQLHERQRQQVQQVVSAQHSRRVEQSRAAQDAEERALMSGSPPPPLAVTLPTSSTPPAAPPPPQQQQQHAPPPSAPPPQHPQQASPSPPPPSQGNGSSTNHSLAQDAPVAEQISTSPTGAAGDTDSPGTVSVVGQTSGTGGSCRREDPTTLHINRKGLDLIKQAEGFRGGCYQDVVGSWHVGYGHLCSPPAPGTDEACRECLSPRRSSFTLTEAVGERLLAQDVVRFEQCVAREISVPLTANQFSALVSFTFNLGCGALSAGTSTLRRVLNNGNYDGVAEQLKRWKFAGGREQPGLVTRRENEARLFNDNICDESGMVMQNAESPPPDERPDHLCSELRGTCGPRADCEARSSSFHVVTGKCGVGNGECCVPGAANPGTQRLSRKAPEGADDGSEDAQTSDPALRSLTSQPTKEAAEPGERPPAAAPPTNPVANNASADACGLVYYTNPLMESEGGKPICIAPEFQAAMDKIAAAAGQTNVRLIVTSSARSSPNVKNAIRGVVPAKRSNHMAGHAIDFKVRHQRGVCDAICLRDLSRAPGEVREFVLKVKAHGLRWGGDFAGQPDPIHFDDGLNLPDGNEKWNEAYARVQEALRSGCAGARPCAE